MGRNVNVFSGLDGAVTSTTAMLTPQKEGGDTHQVLSVLRSYWQLVAAEGQKKLFFFEIVTLIVFPHSSGWPHTHAHMGSVSWTSWFIKQKRRKEDLKLRGNMLGRGNKGSWRGRYG